MDTSQTKPRQADESVTTPSAVAKQTDMPRSGAERRERLLHHLYGCDYASIGELVVLLGASEATLRRDLAQLETEGFLRRSHGGARMVSGSDERVAFELRERDHLEAKRAIADAAWQLIESGSTILLDSGTTVMQLARRLRIDPIPLTVFTDGLKIAQELTGLPGIDVSLLGGRLRAENLCLDGPLAEAMLDRLWFDHLFVGAGAIGDDLNVYSIDAPAASLNAAMIRRSDRCHVLADASKFGNRATYLVESLKSVTTVVVDTAVTDEWRRKLVNESSFSTTVASSTPSPDAIVTQ